MGLCLGQRGDSRPPGREEIIAAGICLAVTLTGSDGVGPSEGWSLRTQNADKEWRLEDHCSHVGA